jgi:hypothetical protein
VSLSTWPFYAIFGVHPGPQQRIVAGTHIIINVIYLFLAQRRYYGQSNGKTTFKTALAYGGMYAVSVTILAGALVAAMFQYR